MIIVQAMERRGEIDTRLMETRPVPGRPGCAGRSPYILDRSVQGAFTISCGCFGPAGNRKPNPRIRVHTDLVSRERIDRGAPLQMGAETLHSTLLHEYRHVWVRVFVNWDFLAPEQQRVFAARIESARRRVAAMFPRVNWRTDPGVLATRRWCNSLAGGARGTCDSPMATTYKTMTLR